YAECLQIPGLSRNSKRSYAPKGNGLIFDDRDGEFRWLLRHAAWLTRVAQRVTKGGITLVRPQKRRRTRVSIFGRSLPAEVTDDLPPPAASEALVGPAGVIASDAIGILA